MPKPEIAPDELGDTLRVSSPISVRMDRSLSTYLVAVDTHMMCGGEGLEDDDPAGIGGPFKQRVGHLRDVHVGGVGG